MKYTNSHEFHSVIDETSTIIQLTFIGYFFHFFGSTLNAKVDGKKSTIIRQFGGGTKKKIYIEENINK